MIDENTLTLYYFNDGLSDKERQEVANALATDHLLAARFESLSEALDAMSQDSVTPAPAHLKHQWHDLVAREAQLERQKATAEPGDRRPWLGWGSALVATLALGVAIGVFLSPDNPTMETPDLASTPGEGPMVASIQNHQAFERGLTLYLEESRHELVSMDERSDDERNTLLLQIVAQNRLFEHAAEQQDAPEIARLMRALEPVLLRLAESDTEPQDAEALRAQLAFELNAMLTKLQRSPSKATTRT